jgi:hypothetical protein
MTLLIQANFIVYLLPIFIGITTVLLLIIFLILNHFGYFFNYNSKGSLIVPIISSQFILGIFLILFLNFVLEYSMKLIRIYFNNTLSSKLILSKYNLYKKRTRTSSSINRSNNSFSRNKIKENESEKSNNTLISKNSLSNINLINEDNNNKKRINKSTDKRRIKNENNVYGEKKSNISIFSACENLKGSNLIKNTHSRRISCTETNKNNNNINMNYNTTKNKSDKVVFYDQNLNLGIGVKKQVITNNIIRPSNMANKLLQKGMKYITEFKDIKEEESKKKY